MTLCYSLSCCFSFDKVETWVTPDMQWEEMVPQPNGTKLPMLSLIVRGYKFVLRAKESQQHDGRTQYGLFASCTSLKSGSNMDEELNFRVSQGTIIFHQFIFAMSHSSIV